MTIRLGVLGAAVALAACTAPKTSPGAVLDAASEKWRLADHIDELKQTSCGGVAGLPEAEISIAADEIEIGGSLNGLSYIGGWHLTSNVPEFGGLSGLEVLPDGNLIAVSDQGSIFRIGLARGVPDGTGTHGLMRGAYGAVFDNKSAADAEGVVYKDGVVLVSFERDHRVLAYAYDECGSAARGIEIAKLPSDYAGEKIGANSGAEALSIDESGELTFGYEQSVNGKAPLGSIYANGAARFDAETIAPDGPRLVGRDELHGMVAELFRDYNRSTGNHIVIRVGDIEASMKRPMTVDNFEGIALQELEDGTLRVWIISDDNFNPMNQRTLLMAFDRPHLDVP